MYAPGFYLQIIKTPGYFTAEKFQEKGKLILIIGNNPGGYMQIA